MERNCAFRGPVRELIRLILRCWAKFELIKFVDNWPETQPQQQENDQGIKGFLQQLNYSTPQDWKHLAVQAVYEGCVPMQMVIRHLVYHCREGTQIFRKWHFPQDQPEFAQDVMHVVQKMDLANRLVYGFNEPGFYQSAVRAFKDPGFRNAIRHFLRVYGIPDTPETTDPLVEEWEMYEPDRRGREEEDEDDEVDEGDRKGNFRIVTLLRLATTNSACATKAIGRSTLNVTLMTRIVARGSVLSIAYRVIV
ncbi:hypothetical protein FANTH_4012 [Fusarium anthophilum]|uniref:Uncharacterized protein n=1 Tax=Fusarium anthophilum TaxID=48485 RepID=A0A8H5E8Q8_9HYPO|nr:hypothetical protein FANTH_4012 [Fusarium anthophilum]